MGYISDIFERADIQHIREFFLNGVECAELDHTPYKERLKKAEKAAIEMIKAKFPDMSYFETITGELYLAFGVFEDVYMKIGLKTGVMLAVQFLGGDRGN